MTGRIAALATAMIVAFSGIQAAQAEDYVLEPTRTFRLAHGNAPGSPYDLGANRFAELVEVYSRGAMKVDVYPAAQLGGEQAVAKDVQLGVIDMTAVPTQNASMWYKPMDVFVLPFLFRDRFHVEAVINGPVGQELFEEYREASGLRIISVFEYGNRAPMNSVRPIETPADFAGIKFRVPKSDLMIDTYQALGANPTAIDWGDLYGALQQGVADGLEGPPQNMIDAKFYEFLNYYSYVDPFFGVVIMIMNDGIFESLSDEEKAVILQAGEEAGRYQRWVSAKSHVDGMARLAERGVEVNVVADRQPFVDAVAPVMEKYKPEIGAELVDQVLAAGK